MISDTIHETNKDVKQFNPGDYDTDDEVNQDGDLEQGSLI